MPDLHSHRRSGRANARREQAHDSSHVAEAPSPAIERALLQLKPAIGEAGCRELWVQLRGQSPGAQLHTLEVASRGVRGAGGSLPHRDTIQAAFGRHDVGGVQAYVGGGAAESARAIGAEAYATGDKVAFRSSPDLHTAAHEAAHVVQQRGGVQLKGGVGQSGDAYERHADAVADLVVAGKSAESLLDQYAGGSASPRALQRKDDSKAPNKGDKDKLDPRSEAQKVKLAHAAELKAIVRNLKGHTSDEDVHNVLYILSHWDSTTITAAWYAIPLEWLEDLLDNMELEHFKKHPREVAATVQRLPDAERLKRVLKLSDAGWFDSVSELEATMVLYLIQDLPPDLLDKFRTHDGGKHYRRFTKKLPGDQKAALAKAHDPKLEAKLRADELKRRGEATKEQDALGKGKDDKTRKANAENAKKAKNALEKIEKLLWTGFSDWAVTDKEAKQVLSEFEAISSNRTLLSGVVRALEAKDLMKKWVENLPEAHAYAKTNVATFIRVLSCRPPELAVQHAIKLISYGLFDWAVTDAEAMLAYHLIRSLPTSAQHNFKMRDTAKWLTRMEDNLQAKVKKGQAGYTGKDGKEGYGLLDKSKDAAKKRAEDHKIVEADRSQLDALVAEAKDAGADEAPSVLAKLVKDPGKVGAYVRYLDRFKAIDALLETLGTAKWKPEHVKTTLAVLKVRDPGHNVATVRELLSTSFWSDWEVTKEEARWAYEIIKVMPPKLREAFIKKEPEWFQKMDENISLELRKSKKFGFYEGGKEANQKLIGQLAEPGIWTSAQSQRLLMVLRMIAQAGLMQKALPHVQAHWTPDNDKKLREIGFVKNGEIKPEHVVDKTDSNTLSTVWHGLGALANSEHWVSVLGWALGFTDTAAIRGLRLADIQKAMGGHVSGIEFGKGESKETDKDKTDAGELDFKLDEEKGLIQVRTGTLPIKSVNVLMGTTTLRAGGGQVTGLNADIKWATDQDARTFLKLGPSSLALSNLMFIKQDRMFGVGSIALDNLKLDGKRPTGDAPLVKTKSGALADVGQVFMAIIKIFAGLVEAIPVVGSAAPFNPLFDGGDEASLSERIKTAFSKNFNVALSFDKLTVGTIVDSHGGHIGKIELGKTELKLTMSRSADCRNQIQALEAKAKAEGRELTAKEKAQVQALEADAKKWEAKEKRYAELKEKKRLGKTLEKEEEKEYATLQKEVSANLSGAIKGKLSLSDVNMAGVKAKSLTLEGVKLGGNVRGLGDKIGAYTDKKGELDALAATRRGGLGTKLDSPGVTFSADRITGKDLSYTKESRRDRALDTVIAALEKKKATGKLSPAEALKLDKAKAERAKLQPLVEEYDKLYADFANLDAKRAKRYAELTKILAAPPSFSVKELDLKGAQLGIDLDDPKGLTFKADHASLKGVTSGDLKVDSVTGKKLDLDVKGGLGSIKAGEIDIKGVKNDATGLSVDRVHGTNIGAGLTSKDGDTQATLQAKKLVVEGLNLGAAVQVLAKEKEQLEAIAKDKRTKAQTKRLAQVEKLLAEHADLKAKVDAAKTSYEAAKGTKKEASTKEALEQATKRLERWGETVRKLTVEDLNLLVSGLGDTNLNNVGQVDPKKLLDKGIKVSGQGPDGQMVGKVTVERPGVDGGKVDKVELTGVKGTVGLSSKEVSFDKFGFDELRISGLDYSSGDTCLSISKSAALKKVQLTGKVALAKVKDKDSGQDKLTPTGVHIDAFDIGTLEAEGLRLDLKASGVTIKLPGKGTLSGIWAKNIDVELPQKDGDKLVWTGAAGVKGVNLPRLKSVLKGKLSATSSLKASGLSIKQASDGTRTLKVGDLNLHTAGTLTKGSKFVVDVRGLKGTVVNKGDTYILQKIQLKDLTVGPTTYQAEGKKLAINKSAGLRGVYVDATVKLGKEGKGKDAKTKLDNLTIKKLTVDEIFAQGVSVDLPAVKADKAKGIEASEAKRLELAKASIKQLCVEEFDLKARRGFIDVKGESSIDKLKLAIGEKGHESLKLNTSLSGKGMSGHLEGPDYTQIDLGTLQLKKLHLEKGGTKVDATGKDLKGVVTLDGDKVIVSGVYLGEVALTNLSFKGKSSSLSMRDSIKLSGIWLEEVELAYETAKPKAKGGKADKKLKSVKLRKFRMDSVDTGYLKYSGTKPINDKGKKGTATTVVAFKSAHLATLKIDQLDYDLAKKKLVLDADLAAGSKLTGLDVKLKEKLKGKATKVVTSIAANATLGKVDAKVTAEEVKKGKGSWTKLTGSVKLSDFGISDLKVNHDGTKIEVDSIKGDAKAELTGNTGAHVTANAKATGIKVETDGTTVEIDSLSLKKLQVGLMGIGADDVPVKFGMMAKELGLKGLDVTLELSDGTTKKVSAKDAKKGVATKTVNDYLHLQPLAGLSGKMYVGYFLDDNKKELAFGEIPIKDGVIDVAKVKAYFYSKGDHSVLKNITGFFATDLLFNKMTGLEVMDEGLVLDIPGPWNKTILKASEYKGMHKDDDEGHIHIKDLSEGAANAKSDPKKTPPDKKITAKVRIEAKNLKLGSGKIGNKKGSLVLKGSGNAVKIWGNLGEDLSVTAKKAIYGEDLKVDLKGKELQGEKVHLKGMKIRLINLSGTKKKPFTIKIGVKDGKVTGLSLGAKDLADLAKLKAKKP